MNKQHQLKEAKWSRAFIVFAIMICILLSNVHTIAQVTWYSQGGGSVIQSNKIYTSSVADTSAVYVTGAGNYSLTASKITTIGNSSVADSSSRSGLDAAVLVNSSSNVVLDHDTINTSGMGANGVFARGVGSSVTVSNSVINTSGIHAHGVDVTYTGVINLVNVHITTTNDTAPAMATDCAGGTLNLAGGIISSSGNRSSGIYSTGTITVSDAVITASGDNGAVTDVNGILSLTNTQLTGAQNGLLAHNTTGSSVYATATFTGGSITALTGHIIYDTAARLNVLLTGGTIISAGSGYLLYALSASTLNCVMNGETIPGNIYADNTSTITTQLQNNTTLTGMVTNAAINIDTTSRWNVSGDSHISSLTDLTGVNTTTLTVSNITGNGHNVYYNSALAANSWLSNKSYKLTGGGCLLPEGAICSTTGINIMENSSDITLYPSPVHDVISIDYPASYQNASFTISTADGRVVTTGKLGESARKYSITVSSLNSGLYLMTIDGAAVKKVMKFCKY